MKHFSSGFVLFLGLAVVAMAMGTAGARGETHFSGRTVHHGDGVQGWTLAIPIELHQDKGIATLFKGGNATPYASLSIQVYVIDGQHADHRTGPDVVNTQGASSLTLYKENLKARKADGTCSAVVPFTTVKISGKAVHAFRCAESAPAADASHKTDVHPHRWVSLRFCQPAHLRRQPERRDCGLEPQQRARRLQPGHRVIRTETREVGRRP